MNLFFKLFKGNGYGKLLKLSFFSLLISCFTFGLGCFASAVVYITDYGMTLSPSSYSNPLLLENNFKLNSILGNTDKNFFYVVHNYNSSSQGYYTFGWKGERLYGYSKSVGCSSNTVYQGYVNKIYKCPCGNPYGHSCSSSETYINTFSDCVFYSDFSIPVFEGLIQGVSKYGYGMITYNDALNVGSCGPVGFMRTPFSSFDNTTSEYWYMIAPDVSDTNNYSLSSSFTVQDVESVINFNSSPLNGQGGSSGTGDFGTGDSSGNINDILTGSYIYTNCTYQALIDYMESVGASKYLCYGGLDNFNLYNPNTVYNPIPGTGKTLAQILAYSNTWDTPLEWYNFWNGLRGGYVDMWSSYPAVYKTWFDIYYQYGGNSLEFDSVREYCAMIGLDIDFSNTVYRGQYFKKTCEYIQRNNIGIYDGSGNVVVGVNWGGIGNYTGVNLSGVVVESPVGYIQNFFNELKANFPTRSDLGGGALPVYIITFLCAVVLFRFLRH